MTDTAKKKIEILAYLFCKCGSEVAEKGWRYVFFHIKNGERSYCPTDLRYKTVWVFINDELRMRWKV
jgi:hypothetical protein